MASDWQDLLNWEHYIFSDNGLAGYSDNINEGAILGRDDNHLCSTDGLYNVIWPEIHLIERLFDEKLKEEKLKTEDQAVKQIVTVNQRHPEDPSEELWNLQQDALIEYEMELAEAEAEREMGLQGALKIKVEEKRAGPIVYREGFKNPRNHLMQALNLSTQLKSKHKDKADYLKNLAFRDGFHPYGTFKKYNLISRKDFENTYVKKDPKTPPFPDISIAGVIYEIEAIVYDQFFDRVIDLEACQKARDERDGLTPEIENAPEQDDSGNDEQNDDEEVQTVNKPSKIQKSMNNGRTSGDSVPRDDNHLPFNPSCVKFKKIAHEGIYLTATEKLSKRPNQKQLAIYRTNLTYVIALAGGNKETDCDTKTPLDGVISIGRHLIKQNL